MDARYEGGPDGRPATDGAAVPTACPDVDGGVGAATITLDVDGQVFTVRAGEFGGVDYTWLSGPNRGYGFSAGPGANLSLEEHRDRIRRFLAMTDPHTGYVENG